MIRFLWLTFKLFVNCDVDHNQRMSYDEFLHMVKDLAQIKGTVKQRLKRYYICFSVAFFLSAHNF